MFEDKFNDILNENEKIIKVIKPNKRRTILEGLIRCILPLLLCVAAFLVFLFYYLSITDDKLKSDVLAAFIPFVILIFLVACFPASYFIYLICSYKNIFYIISDKRFIIRSGFIGIDYKTVMM